MEYEKYLHYKSAVAVTVNDADFRDRLKPIGIMGYFQDIATAHAELLGIGYHDMLKQNLVWVMSRMSFEVMKSPAVGDKLTVVTFPEKPRSAVVNRGYYVFDDAADCVIRGSSQWCVLSADTHTIRNCAGMFKAFSDDVFRPDGPLENANPKIAFPEGIRPERTGDYRVLISELDRNRHMNNSRYGEIVLNACGFDLLNTHRIKRFDINFLSQMFIGDEYAVWRAFIGDTMFVEAKKKGSDSAVFRASVVLEKN